MIFHNFQRLSGRCSGGTMYDIGLVCLDVEHTQRVGFAGFTLCAF